MSFNLNHKGHGRALLSVWAVCALLGLGIESSLISCNGFQDSPFSAEVREADLNLNARNLELIQKRIVKGDFFKVALIADPQRNPLSLQKLATIINARPDIDQIAFALVLGDLAENGLLVEFEEMLTGLRQLSIPFMNVNGNHDSLGMGKEIWPQMFGSYNFSFEYQGAKFVFYNYNRYDFDDAPPPYEWLAAEGADASKRNHTIAVSHVPFVEGESAQDVVNFQKFMHDHGYNYAVNGHIHQYRYTPASAGQGLENFSVSKVADENMFYGMMNVYRDKVTFEQCTPDCIPAQ